MSGFVSIILLPHPLFHDHRPYCAGPAVLQPDQRRSADPWAVRIFEKILPATINTFLPVGLMGLVLTGLLGAFMGTFFGYPQCGAGLPGE